MIVRSCLAAFACSASLCVTSAQAEPERIFVTNEMSGDLSVIDTASGRVTKTIKLGKRPRGIKVAPSKDHLFVALSGSPILPPGADERSAPPADKSADGIGVVDLKMMQVVRIIRGVSDPEQLALSADGKRLYVASEDTGTLKVIDVQSERTLASLKVGGEPEGVTLSPDGRFVCVTSEGDDVVSVIATQSNSVVETIKVGKRPRFCAFSADGTSAFVSGELDASLTVIDTQARKVAVKVTLPGELVRPMGIAVSPLDGTLYVATGRGKTLMSLDARTYQLKQTVTVGERPWNVAISGDGARIYTANGTSNDVTVVDAATMKVLGKIAVGDRPWGIALVGPSSATLSTH